MLLPQLSTRQSRPVERTAAAGYSSGAQQDTVKEEGMPRESVKVPNRPRGKQIINYGKQIINCSCVSAAPLQQSG